MGQPDVPAQSKERRVRNFDEVSFGYQKKLSIDESRRCPQCAQPVCMSGCPLGIDIPGFIRMLREGDSTGALNRIRANNPFPSLCGRICVASCERTCIFHDEDSAIGIRALERFASDNGPARGGREKVVVAPSKGKKVVIVGSGPAGMMAAHELAVAGYGVTVYEALPEPGGVLRYGIPDFRLPRKVLDEEFVYLKNLGVDVQTNVIVGQSVTFEDMFASGYQAVLLALGAGAPVLKDLGGQHLGGVCYAEEFLMRLYLMKGHQFPKYDTPPMIGENVIVIGGGYAAMDCARSLVRLGRKARLVFSGLEEELRIHRQDRMQTRQEGVELESMVHVVEILGGPNHMVTGVKCQRMDFSGDPHQASWELKPVPGSEFVMDADSVIIATGHRPNTQFLRRWQQLQLLDNGGVWTDPHTGMTSMKGIFAAGNVTTGSTFMVEAMTSGRDAARKIMAYLIQS